MSDDKTERKNITQPAAWWIAFEAQAKSEETLLSEWMGECCLANLPDAVQAQLPTRGTRGRPFKKKEQ